MLIKFNAFKVRLTLYNLERFDYALKSSSCIMVITCDFKFNNDNKYVRMILRPFSTLEVISR